ncbi:MAG TPA: SDR family oxidoreductase [Candidatus Dormibacteraeota bacterium]|nr:SDR family oxidoreductase [Candidatus Dormibacteraeota bacterium]
MILLAGGTGHLGGPLIQHLLDGGHHVRVLTRDPSRVRARVPAGVELVAGDVRDGASLGPVLAGVDTVVSAVTGFGPGGRGPLAVDMRGNRNLVDAATAAGVEHFVLVSLHGAALDHPMELYRAKFTAEQALRESSLAWTIVRPTAFMELWAGIVGDPLLRGGPAIMFGRGNNPINFVSVIDVARVIGAALGDPRLPGRTLEIGGPENLTLTEIVEMIAAAHGLQPRVRRVPLPALRVGAALLRPVRPDLAGLVQAAIQMDTTDMTFQQTQQAGIAHEIGPTRLVDTFGTRESSRVAVS